MAASDWVPILLVAGGVSLWVGLAVVRAHREAGASPSKRTGRTARGAGASTAAWDALRAQLGAQGGERITFSRAGLDFTVHRRVIDGDVVSVHIDLVVTGGLAPLAARVADRPDGVTGDADFDGMVRIDGDELLALTLLTPTLRRRLAVAVGQGFWLAPHADGARLVRTYGIEHTQAILDDVAEVSLFGPELRPPSNLSERYFQRLEGEPTRTVRWRLAEVMPIEWLGLPGVLQRVAAHPDPSVRLRVARRGDVPALWATISNATLLRLAEGGDWLAFDVLGERGGVDLIPELRRVGAAVSEKARAEAAIAAIQARVGERGGELSLADDRSGGLSEARERR